MFGTYIKVDQKDDPSRFDSTSSSSSDEEEYGSSDEEDSSESSSSSEEDDSDYQPSEDAEERSNPQSFVLPPDVVPVLQRYYLRRLSWTPIPLRLLLWTPKLLLLWTSSHPGETHFEIA